MLTHVARERNVALAMNRLEQLDVLTSPTMVIRVEGS